MPSLRDDERKPVRQLRRQVNELQAQIATLDRQFEKLASRLLGRIRSLEQILEPYLRELDTTTLTAIATCNALVEKGTLTDEDLFRAAKKLTAEPATEPAWPCELCPPHEHQGEGCELCKPHEHVEQPTPEEAEHNDED